MIEQIAASIRRHRLAAHLTQEELAAALHVTPQAVSRWECAAVLPDVLTLIVMANFFGVSLDTLADAGKFRSDAYLHGVFADASGARASGNFAEAERLLREALHLHPAHPTLQSELALTLMLTGEYAEAIRLCESALAGNISEKVRHTTEACLCRLYRLTGDSARADALMRTLPHIWESREYARIDADPSILANGCADLPALLRALAEKLEKNL